MVGIYPCGIVLQVPLEFDFLREASNAAAIRSTLLEHAEHLPLLRKVCYLVNDKNKQIGH